MHSVSLLLQCWRQPEPDEGPTCRSAMPHAHEQAELVLIMQALRKHGNNRLRAALELGISRQTLYKRLHRYDLMEACSANTMILAGRASTGTTG